LTFEHNRFELEIITALVV